MKQNISWEELARYFAGELEREKHQKMEKWITSDFEREQKVQKLYKIWKESAIPPHQLNVDEAWDNLSENMDKIDEGIEQINLILPERKKTTQRNRSLRYASGWFRRIALAAAVIVIGLITGVLINHYEIEQKKNSGEVAVRQLVAHEGERATYRLSDGSRIVLHAGSRAEVPIQFGVGSREIFLEGEAWFEVAHDPENPFFIVRTQNAYTRVLGTKFLVQAWPDQDRKVEVIVSEGKVALGDTRLSDTDEKQEAIITQNQKGVLTADRELKVTDNVDLDWYLGWIQGRLVFDNRPLSEIIAPLEHWYNIKINLKQKRIGEKKLTAEIDYNQPMTVVLKGIAMSLDLEFEEKERTFTFYLKQNKK